MYRCGYARVLRELHASRARKAESFAVPKFLAVFVKSPPLYFVCVCYVTRVFVCRLDSREQSCEGVA